MKGKHFERGSLNFFLDEQTGIVSVYVDDPNVVGMEAEYVGSFHESYIPQLIAGCIAIKHYRGVSRDRPGQTVRPLRRT